MSTSAGRAASPIDPLATAIDGLRHLAEHARTILRAQSMVFSSAAASGQDIVVAGAAIEDDAPTPVRADLDQPIQASDGTLLGTIRAIDTAPRLWTAGDREVLSDLAGSMAARISLGASNASPLAGEANDTETRATLDHLPGLVFEWRKTGTAAVSYTRFGSQGTAPGTALSAVEALLARPDACETCALLHEDDRQEVKAVLLHGLDADEDIDVTIRVHDQDAVPSYRVQASVRRTEDAVRWAGLVTDVSELAQARREAEAARAAQDVVLVNVSHELRTPLQAIVGFADFLAIETRPERVAGHAKSVKTATSSVLALVNQLLGIAEAEAAEETVRALADACIALVGPQAKEKGLTTTLVVEHDVPDTVVRDRQKLRQALLNLLNNAVKFTDAGHVTLRIARSPTGLRFSVVDTGIGIRIEERGRLFQRFSRIEAEPSAREGTGLGLSITKDLVEAMGGTIDVAGNENGGTTFWIDVPAEEAASSSLPIVTRAAPLPPPRTGGSRVLLADDLDLNRKLIADMLSIEGHQVDCVADGAAAVSAAAALPYDLILMDMIMPGMDGIAATQAIRALPAPLGDVPIVALTANSFPEQLDSCLAAGMDATLTKPMSIDALTKAVAAWTRRRSAAA